MGLWCTRLLWWSSVAFFWLLLKGGPGLGAHFFGGFGFWALRTTVFAAPFSPSASFRLFCVSGFALRGGCLHAIVGNVSDVSVVVSVSFWEV